jgi:hypothetical protein
VTGTVVPVVDGVVSATVSAFHAQDFLARVSCAIRAMTGYDRVAEGSAAGVIAPTMLGIGVPIFILDEMLAAQAANNSAISAMILFLMMFSSFLIGPCLHASCYSNEIPAGLPPLARRQGPRRAVKLWPVVLQVAQLGIQEQIGHGCECRG